MYHDKTNYGLPVEQLAATLPPLMTVRQAAETGLASERQIRKMCAAGVIKSIKVGSDWRIYRDEFFKQYFDVCEVF